MRLDLFGCVVVPIAGPICRVAGEEGARMTGRILLLVKKDCNLAPIQSRMRRGHLFSKLLEE